MASRDDRDVPVPEADRLEQQEPVDPEVGDDQPWPDSPVGVDHGDSDEADRLEQSQVVAGDADEDYAHD